LGFAIERFDHTEDERYWLRGFKTFEETDPGVAGCPVSTLEHPVQSFLWGDFTAKPKHTYTYRIVAMRGRPKNLVQDEFVEVSIDTEDDAAGTHAVYFNRGVAASQAYARKFENKSPAEVPNREAWVWLSRGLEEALLDYICQADGERFALRAALYEFYYPPVLEAFRDAHRSGADVKIVFDAKPTEDSPNEKNRAAIAKARIKGLTRPREANSSFIAHNKFIVLLEDGKPRQVWTGSTNITDGAIFGHSNVGHLVRDPEVASKYLDYWEQLNDDPEASDLRLWTEAQTPVPPEMPPGDSTASVFSPRSSLDALEWYAERMDAASSAVFLTAAFGINDLLESVLARDKDYLRYILLDKEDEDMEIISRDKDNRFAVGGLIGETTLGRQLAEKLTGLNEHVKYIHTKYMLIDPLGDDPLLITGSANFSDASTKNNDENMLVIRGESRVADIYLGEFMRLFNHFYFRHVANQADDSKADSGTGHLTPDDGWREGYYTEGPKQRQRLYFAG
ncbi:MAG TPA: phospholipase D-like domain-containing protein, partial [Rubrobacter sp.]|nr:phospholipase D-like domain-containing protein [Rubrobacter sp.]